MKRPILFTVLTFLLFTSLSLFAYNIVEVFIPKGLDLIESKDLLITETSLMLTEDGTTVDVSGMFNERGFYKSGSVTYDENEIINDFNGNLSYSFPLISKKGPGDLYLDMSLNYNSAVNYQVVAANTYWASTSVMPRYNMTAPGWIFSINGMAVQMLNFETNFFTEPSSAIQNTIYNNKIRLLASGYHLTDKLQPASAGADNKDQIMIMRGDGSVITLERITSNECYETPNYENCYIGDYYSDNKGDYTRARVVYMEGGQEPAYRNRRVSVMKGDGLTYIYEEYKNEYKDFPRNTGSQAFRPQVLLLKEIKDRFGHTLRLSYIYSVSGPIYSGLIYGRPLFSSIEGAWSGSDIDFTYFNMSTLEDWIYINNGGRGTYKIKCEDIVFAHDGSHRSNTLELIIPSNDKISFEYQEYNRTANRVKNPNYGEPGALEFMSLIFVKNHSPDPGSLKRMKTVTNYNGGKREYGYLKPDETLSIDMTPIYPDYKVQSIDGTSYYGQGRDLFYNNMLDEIKVYDGVNHIRTDNFSYVYNDIGTGNEQRYYKPVDENDKYYSTRTTEAIDTEFNYNTPGKLKSEKFYRNYPIFDPTVNPSNPDFPGYTKILWEKFYENDEIDPYKEITYQFKPEQSGPLYTCSFLDTNVTENIKGVERVMSYRYVHNSLPSTINTNDNPIVQKTVYDPFRIRTENYYKIFYDSVNVHYINGYYNPYPTGGQQTETMVFYLIGQLNSTEKYDQLDNPIYKETFDYHDDNNDDGYIGQIKDKKIYNSDNFTDFKQIQYKYFIKDNLGVNLYPIHKTKPSTEGNLKEIIDPKGNVTKYYYHPVDDIYQGDAPPQPVVVNYKMYYDNTVDSVKIPWEDIRFPTITENIPNVDVSLYSYKKYYPSGNVWKDLNHYNFITEFTYDDLDRLLTAILPYDFDDSQYSEITITDTTYIPVDYTLKSTVWGYYEEGLPPLTFCLITDPYDLIEHDEFKLDIYKEGGPPPDNPGDYSRLALMKFDENDTIIENLSELRYAHFEYFPTFCTTNVDQDTSIDKVYIKIQTFKDIQRTSNPLDPCGDALNLQFGSESGEFEIPRAFRDEESCTTLKYSYPDHYTFIDVTEMIRNYIINESDILAGFSLRIKPRGTPPDPHEDHKMYLSQCIKPTTAQGVIPFEWQGNYAPRINIGGTYMHIETTIIPVYSKATLRYVYLDDENITQIYSALDHQTDKKTEHLFDGFYRVKESRLYTGLDEFNSTFMNYNYLDLQAKTIDGRGNASKFSYDELLNLKQTENADNSNTLVDNGYQDGLTNYFGSIPGFVNWQKFTDEEGNEFIKYFNAVGNLIRETKYVDDIPTDDIVAINTDYRYDSLYRVTHVKTPEGKIISYTYDGYGRQMQRTTPDAGTVKYKYDINDNLRFSQDANQDASSSDLVTFRGYDGINRLLYIGEAPSESGEPNGGWSSLNPDGVVFFENYSQYPDYFLTINVYDTLSTAVGGEFSPPGDYYNTINYTKGNLIATAYRTRGSDPWNYKYYRYDVRGRVIRMWHVIDGLETKVIDYTYNSQNQVTHLSYQNGVEEEFKKFRYVYDKAGRLKDVNIFIPEPMDDYENFTSYEYNQNSQVSKHSFKDDMIHTNYGYNSRNWIALTSDNNIFRYGLNYFKNGNVKSQHFAGSYPLNFVNQGNLNIAYTYDPSNRLLKADAGAANTFDLENTYDYDGNIETLKRYGSNDNLLDDFNYSYISGTNKLSKVSGGSDQFTYDDNGNLTGDMLEGPYDIKYDHRNLLTEFKKLYSENETDWTRYYYDEAGNRIRKVTMRTDQSDPPDPQWDNIGDDPIWWVVTNEYYIRGVGGNTIAEYDGTTLEQWNVWGTDNVGKITKEEPEENKYYYLKDHLGSIRAVIDGDNSLVSAQDYDMWGFLLENRTFNIDEEKYKFTGKERDIESSYDYFGARYYMSRIGRWGSVEPLIDKYVGVTPYCYALDNSIALYDPTGKDVRAATLEFQEMILNTIPIDLQVNIVFNEQGYIDKLLINLVENTTSGNFESLKQLVNDPRLYDVMIADKFSYSDESGKIQPFEMGPISYTDDPSPMSPRTGEIGFLGQTLFPGRKENTFNSPGDYIGIIVNEALSSEGRAQVFSHEGYGHAYLYSLGIDGSHNWVNVGEMEFVETNEVLLNQIENRIEETIINMEDQ